MSNSVKSVYELVPQGVAYPPDFGSPTTLATRAGNTIYVSGMIAWNEKRQIVGVADPYEQTLQALRNMALTLQSDGADLTDIVKITFYLTDISHKSRVWEARKAVFGDHRPASTLVAVTRLVDPQALLEIDAVAYVDR